MHQYYVVLRNIFDTRGLLDTPLAFAATACSGIATTPGGYLCVARSASSHLGAASLEIMPPPKTYEKLRARVNQQSTVIDPLYTQAVAGMDKFPEPHQGAIGKSSTFGGYPISPLPTSNKRRSSSGAGSIDDKLDANGE